MARQTAVNTRFIEELEMIRTVLHTDPKNNLVSEVIDENTLKLVFEHDKKEELSFNLLIPVITAYLYFHKFTITLLIINFHSYYFRKIIPFPQ